MAEQPKSEDDRMSIRKPSSALLRELNDAVQNAPVSIKGIAGEKAISFLMTLYPEWSNCLMDLIESEEGEFDPAEFLSLTTDEQLAALKRWAGKRISAKH